MLEHGTSCRFLGGGIGFGDAGGCSWCGNGLGFDSREALNPVAEIAREDKRAPTPFNRTKFAGIDRLIERGPASARDRARLCYAVRKR